MSRVCKSLAEKLGKKPRRVLVVQKRTRLVRETLRHPCYLENLRTLGREEDGFAIKTRHDVHEANLAIVLTELRKYFPEVRLVHSVQGSDRTWPDMFISAGGDGTYLNVASQLDGGQLLVGLNTDPERSAGYLCVRSKSGRDELKHIIGQLSEQQCHFIKRTRIRVRLTYPCIGEYTEVEIPRFALNDVYMGETSPTRLSYLELKIGELPAERQKSSGFLVCTGSGSTAWGYHVNQLDPYRTGKLMEVLGEAGLLSREVTPRDLSRVMQRFNESFVFSADSPRMKFITREALQSHVFRATHTQGWADNIMVKSLCWNGKIVMDGVQRKFNFDDGVIANFSTNPSDSICSVRYVD